MQNITGDNRGGNTQDFKSIDFKVLIIAWLVIHQ